jgi:hypothetical protein
MPDNSTVTQKSILTIATTKKTYVEMACNLAMSFLLWNDTADIDFFLVTDCPELIPKKLQQKIKVVNVSAGALGDGFSSKLHMEQFSYTAQTLFIDADCLVYGNLNPAFDAFKDHSVSAIGYNRYEGKDVGFCKDIAQVIINTDVKYFPLICGSVYYIEKGETASKIFAHAISLLKSYNEIGFVKLRNKENEEPLIAVSMAKFNQNPVNDTGLIKADRMFYEFLETNVIEGKAKLWNHKNIPIPEYSTLKLALPLIVHFNASYAELFEYESEVIRLKKVFLENRGVKTANLYADLLSVIPGKLSKTTKDIFRPIYNSLFGYRKIRMSKRM